MIELRNYQKDGIQMLYDSIRSGNKRIAWVFPTGAGKCLAKGTPVIMYDGSIRPVESIVVGDLLMGPDSESRYVTSLVRGHSLMYRITPVKGVPFECNHDHILSLICIGKKSRFKYGEVVNIKVKDYLGLPKSVKHVLKLYRTGVSFEEKHLNIDPYWFGLWLGDGCKSSSRITTADPEIVDFLKSYSSEIGLSFKKERNHYNGQAETYSISSGRGGDIANKFNITSILKDYDVYQNKHIPEDFKINSRENRLQLLAGLIDSDGHLSKGYYEIITKGKRIADDIAFLGRSLGFAVNYSIKHNKRYNRDYHRLTICGEISEIPCRVERKKADNRKQIKDVLHSGFTVKEIGYGNYYGFSLAGSDHLFLLGDFTVTHNSTIASRFVKACVANDKRVLFFVHSKELVQQFSARLRNQFHILSGVIMAGVDPRYYEKVQVASVQTLVRRKLPPADVVIIDETHRAKANTYQKIIKQYPDAVLIGLTATPFRTDGKGLGDIFEDIVQPVKIRKLIDDGYLVGTEVFVPKDSVKMDGVRTVAGDWDKKEMANRFGDVSVVKGVVENYQKHAAGKKTIVFNVNVEHSKEVCEKFNAAGIRAEHLDGTTSKEIRTRIVRAFSEGKIQVLCNVNLFTEGFDVPDTEAVILNRATQSLGLYVQMVGRGLRPASGKDKCIVLDHGENTIRHGFVEDYDSAPFKLQVTEKKGKKKKKQEDKTKPCPKCDYVVPFFDPKCVKCGYEFPRKERKVTFGEGTEFIALDREAMIIERLVKIPYKKAVGTIPLSQLRIFAVLRGYKQGWWFHAAIDEGYLPDIEKDHPNAFSEVKFRIELAEAEAGTSDLYKRLQATSKGRPSREIMNQDYNRFRYQGASV